jgi:hypothetical protein
MFVSYEERQIALTQLRFNNYQEYLDSKLWKVIRKHILERDVNFCRARKCNNRSNEVHHFNYGTVTLLGQSPQTLVTLCRACHEKAHFDKEKSLPLKQVQIRTLEMVIGTSIKNGVSNPSIGKWFRNQYQCNIQVRKDILKELAKIGITYSPEQKENVDTSCTNNESHTWYYDRTEKATVCRRCGKKPIKQVKGTLNAIQM